MEAKAMASTTQEHRLVYVRPVAVAGLPDAMQTEIGDLKVVYSVHAENGEQLALVANRDLAFSLARQHDMAPVFVH
jgi:hypothetical protein